MILPPIIAIDSRRTATAADTTTAGLCDPTTNVHYGDGSTDITASDTGIATYVGGNMYIGSPNGATWSADAINGSYAAEAEGQTVVRGDLLARPIKKGSDGKSFFTLGMVAFGAQYLPAAGTTILAVGGKVGSNPGAISTLGGGDTDHAQAWNAPVGIKSKATNTSKEYDYKAYIAGKQSTVWGDPATPSVRAYTNTASNAVTWSGTTGLAGSGIVGATKKQSDIASLSENLSSLTSTGVVTTGVAPTGKYTRYKYDSSKSYGMTFTNDTVNYTVGSQTYSGINNEKVLFFAGDGHSNNQVFNVTVSQLNSDGYRGLDFAFSNIPANASVIINVVKDDGSSLASTDTVSFNTGWRFWWNNDEISNGYVTSGKNAVDPSISNAYATAGESIMWNFGNAGSVTIGGGKAYEGLTAAGGKDNNASLDDPAAAMLGSILLASGSFDDHVTTNGRVWVGGDFMMNNPTGNANGASTASVIDMDQERHNLPWASNGSSCAAIGWLKYGSDASGVVPAGGSSWGVFAKEQDASKDENAILYVTDNSTNDWSSQSGSLEVHGLNINATYYVREVSPPDGYKNNDHVYTVSTTSDWASQDTNLKSASGVYMVKNTDANGKAVCGSNIYNICDAPSTLTWKKVASDGTKLPGSKWSLTNKDTNAEYEVDDLTKDVTGLTLTSSTDKRSASLKPESTDQTKVTVTPDGATSAIRYASTDTNVVSVNSTGLITAHAAGKAQVVAYAGDKKSTIQVSVFSSGSTTSTDTGGPISIRGASIMQPNEQQRLMLRQNGMALADPSVATWTSSDPSVATVTGSNVTTGACASASGCQVTITAQYQGYTDTFNITVASSNVVTWKNPITIYYYTPRRPSWNAYYLHYAFVKNGSAVFNNNDIKMDSACSNWVKATVTNADALPLVVTFTDGSGTSTNAHWDSNNSKNYYLGAGYDTYVFDQESNGTNHTAPSCSVTSLSVIGSNVAKDGTMTMQSNTTSQLNATIEPAGAANVTWASDNTAVATVDGTGLVTARKAGTATITATAGGQQALINLTVRPKTDGEVIVGGNDEMVVGRTQTLTAQLDGEKPVTITSWKSSKPDVATVDQNGRVTAVSAGTTTITATGYDKAAGPNSGTKTGTMTLNVVATPPYWNDVDATGGQFKVNGLPDGSYKLCETTPPSGYATGGSCYTFTLSAGKVTSSTIPDAGVTNIQTTVEWSKVDADNAKTKLEGSAWKITSKDASVWCVADGGTTASKVTNCTTSGSGKVLADDDAVKGVIKVTGLPAGTYTLNEVQAPSGYELRNDSYTMVVSGTASKKSTVGDSDNLAIPNAKSYGRVRWAKYDVTAQSGGTHQALKGSDWQLFKCESTVTSPSTTACTESVQTFDGTSASTFEYDSLELNTYYLLVETKAPDGYLLSDAPYYAVIATGSSSSGAWGTVTVLSKDPAAQDQVGAQESDGTYPIYNRKAATAKWKKTEYGSGTALEGSEWTLTQYADATASSALRVYKITYTAPTGSATQGSYAMSCTVGADSKNRCSTRYAGKLSVTSPEGASAKSVFSVSGLPWGYYVLTETKAPSGHLIGDAIAGKSVGGKTASAVFTIDYGTVTNEATITSLPMTGGEWTPRNVVIAGLIVLGVAAVSYGIARRRRRK